jgi:hypothetical protein
MPRRNAFRRCRLASRAFGALTPLSGGAPERVARDGDRARGPARAPPNGSPSLRCSLNSAPVSSSSVGRSVPGSTGPSYPTRSGTRRLSGSSPGSSSSPSKGLRPRSMGGRGERLGRVVDGDSGSSRRSITKRVSGGEIELPGVGRKSSSTWGGFGGTVRVPAEPLVSFGVRVHRG